MDNIDDDDCYGDNDDGDLVKIVMVIRDRGDEAW